MANASLPSFPIFRAADHLNDVVDAIEKFDNDGHPRLIQCVDGFSGAGGITKEYERYGANVASFDIARDNDMQNLLTKNGFYFILSLVLRIERWGSMPNGFPCSNFVYMSSNIHKRTKKKPLGNLDNQLVRQCNIMAENWSIVLTIAHLRDVLVVLEQPGSSRLFDLPFFATFLKRFKWHRIWTWMTEFNCIIPKPTCLWANYKEAKQLKRTWSRQRSRARAARLRSDKCISKKNIKRALLWARSRRAKTWSDGKWVTGGSHLADSGAWTVSFCRAVWRSWSSARGHFDRPRTPQKKLDRATYLNAIASVGFSPNVKSHVALPVNDPIDVSDSDDDLPLGAEATSMQHTCPCGCGSKVSCDKYVAQHATDRTTRMQAALRLIHQAPE